MLALYKERFGALGTISSGSGKVESVLEAEWTMKSPRVKGEFAGRRAGGQVLKIAQNLNTTALQLPRNLKQNVQHMYSTQKKRFSETERIIRFVPRFEYTVEKNISK
ncbi:hypothetical protein Trydic_g22512 [Trypoxylus dichotomus]